MRGGAILDAWDNPIAYFPVHAKNVNIHVVPVNSNPGPYCDASVQSKYDALDNLPLFIWPNQTPAESVTDTTSQATAVHRVQLMLGDTGDGTVASTTPDGTIDGSETPIEDHPYLLWSAGSDGKFSVQDPTSADAARQAARCDDVTNFK